MVVLLLLGMLYALLQTPYVQTRLVNYLTERIEQSTGVRIQIGHVNFRPMKSLVLNDVLLCDHRKDTLIFCHDLEVKIDSFDLMNKSFTVKEVVLDESYFNLWTMRGDSGAVTNIEMFIDSLWRHKTETEPVVIEKKENVKGWLVALEKVSIRRSRFMYREEEFEPVDYGVNWTDVDCSEFNVDVSGFDFSGEYMRMKFDDLCLLEKSGLRIEELDGRLSVKDGHMVITEGRIRLERSDVDLVKLEYNWTPNQHDWRNFITKMQQYYEMGPSYISFIDLAYFNGVLRGINNTVKCSGVLTGTINELKGDDLYFELGEKSVFQGKFRSYGLPAVRNTVFDIELNNAHLSPPDLATVYLPWFDMNIPIPSPLYKLSYVDLERVKFDGTISDFLVNAKSVTPDLAGDLSFVYTPCAGDSVDCSGMSGDFNISHVNLGKFAGVSWMGNGAMTGSYSGQLDRGGMSFNVKSTIHDLGVNKGNIRNTDLFLTLVNDKIDLMVSLDDKNTKADVVVAYDPGDSLDFTSVRGHVDIDDLAAFGWSCCGGYEAVGASFNLVYAGKSGNSFTNLTLDDVKYSNDRGAFRLDKISVEDSRLNGKNLSSLYSDVADVSVSGDYRNVDMLEFGRQILDAYVPAYRGLDIPLNKTTGKIKADFTCNVLVKNADSVLKVVFPDLRVSPGMQVSARFSDEEEKVRLSLKADTIRYQDFCLMNSGVELSGDGQRLKMKYQAQQIEYGGFYRLYNVLDVLDVAENQIDNELSWCNWARTTYSGKLASRIILHPDEKNKFATEIQMRPGLMMMADSVWHMAESSIFIRGKNISINNFGFRKGNEFLLVNGDISESSEPKLSVSLSHFNLSDLARMLLSRRAATVFGSVTGQLTLQDYYKDLLLVSDFQVTDWGINRDTLGTLHLRSYWDADSRSIIVGAENRVNDDVPLVVAGYYIPATDSLNVDVRLKEIGLNRLGAYATDYVSNVSGYLSGNMNISGKSSRPDISGFVYLDSVGVKINALNTNFYVHDSVHIVNNRFLFKNFKMEDEGGNVAMLNGDYQMWENKYALDVSLQNFLLLNTDFSHNELFYGRLYLSGVTRLNNRDGHMNINVNARTENNSKLYIPLTSASVEESNNFLHFVNTKIPEKQRNQVVYASTGSNINLDANLELNENLEVQVIFDPTVGDILRASGNGDIRVTLDKDGSLNMFGQYKVSKGDYLFTLSNLVNKKFVLTPGGSISWSGSPYDATLNLNAVYNLKTSLTELLPEDVGSGSESGQEATAESRRKVPVECVLNLSDNLINPVVKFDINFPTLETQTRSYIQSLFSSPDEVTKQMFSLLVLNKFYRTDDNMAMLDGNQAQTMGVTTVTEMMSNQLSRWLSQISNNVDIGLAYRMGEQGVTTDEIEVALSTQLLNDRITISANGNVDVGGGTKTTDTDNRKTNIAGDFDIDVKLNKQGSLKLKAYSHMDEKLIYNNTETIQGVGISYQESFDVFRELLHKYFVFLKRKQQNKKK